MANKTLSRTGIEETPHSYEGFIGIDTSRDKTVMDTGTGQALVSLNNGFCDWRGRIVRDGGATRMYGQAPITHMRFYRPGRACWSEQAEGGVSLNSDQGHKIEDLYQRDTPVSSATFNDRAQVFAPGYLMKSYDGKVWRDNTSSDQPKPGFGAAIQRRLALAGFLDKPTEVHLSRVDDENIMPGDELRDETEVTRAGFIDVRNLLNTADQVTGLGVFENDRLAIFTNDQALVYIIDPDIEKWVLDERANIRVGCISHNTIQNTGGDLVFCSRDGIHSLRRNENNALMFTTVQMSFLVQQLYRRMIRSVDDTRQISAVFDQDNGQYHVFFPQPGNFYSKRLTLTFNPTDNTDFKFSTGDFLNARCGDQLSGTLAFGTSGGVYSIHNPENQDAEVYPTLTVTTPILWHQSLTRVKSSRSLILQAFGKGQVQIEAYDDTGRLFNSFTVETDEALEDDTFPDAPITRQHNRRFEHRYRGVQLRLISEGRGLQRITGFAITTRDQG